MQEALYSAVKAGRLQIKGFISFVDSFILYKPYTETLKLRLIGTSCKRVAVIDCTPTIDANDDLPKHGVCILLFA
jgi:hypothetical protein